MGNKGAMVSCLSWPRIRLFDQYNLKAILD
jgi:hypothetical protein